jgi:hypothetical protein
MPRDATRNIEVGREIDTALDAFGGEAVKSGDIFRDGDEFAVLIAGEEVVMVVDAKGVVAEAGEAFGQFRRSFRRFGIVRLVAEVDAA